MIRTYNRKRFFWGGLALLFFTINLVFWIIRDVPMNFMWACHLGALLVGAGLIFNFRLMNGIGVLWLGLGHVMWLLYMLGGGEVFITSILTHTGGLIIGVIGVIILGMPKLSWLWGVAGMVLLHTLSRWTTPETANINLAFRVHEGWESLFPSFFWYRVMLFFISGFAFLIMQQLLKKIIEKQDRDGAIG